MPAARYVALGDSQTEGLLDPDGRGGYRGWADRFAEILTAANPQLCYANLAVRGKLLGEIRDEQLDAALAMQPDLATVMGGLNDLLRPKFDLDDALAHLDAMITALRTTGAVVATNTFPAIERIAPPLRRLAPRVVALNQGIRDVAARHDALVADFARHDVGTDLRIWSPDRIHANALGHSLIAAAFADTVGVPGYDDWSEPLPARPPARKWQQARADARWLGSTVAPWLLRRVRGRSSGDSITAKRPRLVPVRPVFHLVTPDDWPPTGTYRPASLADEGFVHLSFAEQVAGSANRHLAEASELMAVELDPVAIDADVRVEDSYGSGTAYPHAYGPLPVAAAIGTHRLARDNDGRWTFSPRPAGHPTPAADHR